jgi:hypothetical protein
MNRLQVDMHSADFSPTHCRYYRIAGITIRVTSDLPMDDSTFEEKFSKFQMSSPGEDSIFLHHHFTLPELVEKDLGRVVYRKKPWIIYQQDRSWMYHAPALFHFAVFNEDHTRGVIYNDQEKAISDRRDALTRLTSDQILLARILPDRQALLLHAAGIVMNGQGLLFVGHSDAGKSTMVKMLADEGEILCDDRIIVRCWPEGFRIHGTWCHGDVPDVSPGEAPLRAILLLQKSDTNRLELMEDYGELARALPFFIIKPLVTADWWDKVLAILGKVIREVPVYRLHFDRSGQVKEVLRQLLPDRERPTV